MSTLRSTGDLNGRTLTVGLSELIGQPLASVEFVRDYIQLHFDGPTLTAYSLPTISLESSKIFAYGDGGWRDALCEQIGSAVHRVEVLPNSVSLTFEYGTVISISLRNEDYKGPEALHFSLDANHSWVA